MKSYKEDSSPFGMITPQHLCIYLDCTSSLNFSIPYFYLSTHIPFPLAIMSADKAPAAKLPLAVRKNCTRWPLSMIFCCPILTAAVRDSYENKKEGFESELTALLGTPWTVSIDPLSIYPYAEPDSYGANSLGDCVAA
jgi:hypothetical protein